jgi:hypothetical protein
MAKASKTLYWALLHPQGWFAFDRLYRSRREARSENAGYCKVVRVSVQIIGRG